MLKLSDFVREAITEIVAGVKASQDSVASGTVGGVLGTFGPNGKFRVKYQGKRGEFPDSENCYRQVCELTFDVVVTSIDETGKSGGIGVLGGVVGLGGKMESATSNTTASRIQFTVPLVLP